MTGQQVRLLATVLLALGAAAPQDPPRTSNSAPTPPASVLRVASQGGDYQTIQAAVDAAPPGAVILVADGTYAEAITIARPNLTLRSASRHGAKIASPPGRDAVRIEEGANYITIDGFDITCSGNGIHANKTGIDHIFNHHTIIRNCHIHDCGAAGIQLNHGDYRLVENNVVDHCAAVSRWFQSGISFWQPIALDRKPGFHIIVRGNVLYGNSNPPGGPDGSGLIIDDFRHTQYGSKHGEYPNSTLVENNVSYNNGARGIHVYKSVHVVVRNNTVYHNNWDLTNNATWRGELSCVDSSDVKWYDNIAVADSSVNPHNTAMLDADVGGYRNQGIEWVGNVLFDTAAPASQSIKLASDTDRAAILANNMLGAAPMFVAPGKGPDADFRLKAGSPGIGAADAAKSPTTDLLGMLRDAQPDVGAYEFGATVPAPQKEEEWQWSAQEGAPAPGGPGG
jgi:parallel beta-helix repeat protein